MDRKYTPNGLRRIIDECVRGALHEAVERGNYIVSNLKRKHSEYNDAYFGGALNDVEIVLVNQPASRTVGCYVPKVRKRKGIVTTSYRLESATIKFNTAYVDDEDEINNTLLHEMCHQWVYDTYVDGKAFDTLTEAEEIKDFERSFRSDGGHGQVWLDIAAKVSRASGFEITRTSDTARKTDEAEAVVRARMDKVKEIVVGMAKLGRDDFWFAFMTTRAYIPKLVNGYNDDVQWRWYSMRTNSLNGLRGWCTKTTLSNVFGRGQTPEETLVDFKKRMGNYIGEAEIVPMDNEEQSDFTTYVGVLFDDFSKYYCWIFKPSNALVKAIGCGAVRDMGIDGRMCIAKVDSKDVFGRLGGNPLKNSSCMLKAAQDEQDARAWFNQHTGGVPRELADALE